MELSIRARAQGDNLVGEILDVGGVFEVGVILLSVKAIVGLAG